MPCSYFHGIVGRKSREMRATRRLLWHSDFTKFHVGRGSVPDPCWRSLYDAPRPESTHSRLGTRPHSPSASRSRRLKPRPHQQQCRSNIVECYKRKILSTKSKTLLRHCCLLLQHCCRCGRGFRRRDSVPEAPSVSIGLLLSVGTEHCTQVMQCV